jgi:hypothetical protein
VQGLAPLLQSLHRPLIRKPSQTTFRIAYIESDAVWHDASTAVTAYFTNSVYAMQPDMLFQLLITQRRRPDRSGRKTARITELKQKPEGNSCLTTFGIPSKYHCHFGAETFPDGDAAL